VLSGISRTMASTILARLVKHKSFLVAVDCSAKFQEKSPVAQGSRFKEHIVRCIVVLRILKRRFYQVRVAEEDYTNYQEDSSVPVRDQEHP